MTVTFKSKHFKPLWRAGKISQACIRYLLFKYGGKFADEILFPNCSVDGVASNSVTVVWEWLKEKNFLAEQQYKLNEVNACIA